MLSKRSSPTWPPVNYWHTTIPTFRSTCDASPYGVGAVLSHIMPDGSEKHIAYASLSLATAEKNYSQLDKEALAIIFGIKRFHQYIYGRKFQLVSDCLSRLPMPQSVPTPPVPGDTIMLLEKMEEFPVNVSQIRTWTNKDPLLSRVRKLVQCGFSRTSEIGQGFETIRAAEI